MGQDILGIDPRSRVTAGQNLGQLGQGVGNMFMLQAQLDQQRKAQEAAVRKEKAQRIRDMALQNLGVIRESMGRAAAAKMSPQELRDRFEPAIRQYTEVYQAGDDEVENLYTKYFTPQISFMAPGQVQPLSLAPQETAALPFTRQGQGFGMPSMPLGGEQPPEQRGFGLRPSVPPLGEAPPAAGPGGFGISAPESPIIGPGELVGQDIARSDMTTEAITTAAGAEAKRESNESLAKTLDAAVPSMIEADQERARKAVAKFRATGDATDMITVSGDYKLSAGQVYNDFTNLVSNIRIDPKYNLLPDELTLLEDIEKGVTNGSSKDQIAAARRQVEALGRRAAQSGDISATTIPALDKELSALAASTAQGQDLTALRDFYQNDWLAIVNDPNASLADKQWAAQEGRRLLALAQPAANAFTQSQERQQQYGNFITEFGRGLTPDEKKQAEAAVMSGDFNAVFNLQNKAMDTLENADSVIAGFNQLVGMYSENIKRDPVLQQEVERIATIGNKIEREAAITKLRASSNWKTMGAEVAKEARRDKALKDYSANMGLQEDIAAAIPKGPERLEAVINEQKKLGFMTEEEAKKTLDTYRPIAEQAVKYNKLIEQGNFASVVTQATENGDVDMIDMFGKAAGLSDENITARKAEAATNKSNKQRLTALELARAESQGRVLQVTENNTVLEYVKNLANSGSPLDNDLAKIPKWQSAYDTAVTEKEEARRKADEDREMVLSGVAMDRYAAALKSVPLMPAGGNPEELTPEQEAYVTNVLAPQLSQVYGEMAEGMARNAIKQLNQGKSVNDLQTESLRQAAQDGKEASARAKAKDIAGAITEENKDESKQQIIDLLTPFYGKAQATIIAEGAVRDFSNGVDKERREISFQMRSIKNQEWQKNFSTLQLTLENPPRYDDQAGLKGYRDTLKQAYVAIGYSNEAAAKAADSYIEGVRRSGGEAAELRDLNIKAQKQAISINDISVARGQREEAQRKLETAAGGIPINVGERQAYGERVLVPILTQAGYTKDQADRISKGILQGFQRGLDKDALSALVTKAQLDNIKADTARTNSANDKADNPNGTPYQQAQLQLTAYTRAAAQFDKDAKTLQQEYDNFVKTRKKRVGNIDMWVISEPGEPERLANITEVPKRLLEMEAKIKEFNTQRQRYEEAAKLLGAGRGTPLSNEQLKKLGLPIWEAEDGAPVQGIPKQVNSNNARAAYPAIQKAANQLGINPDFLMNVIAKETSGTFSPSIKNPTSSATGMFQIMDATAKEMGYASSADFLAKNPTVDKQMQEFVRYAQRWGLRPGASEAEIYAVIAAPASLKGGPNDVVYARGSEAARANPSWDVNKDGQITRDELAQSLNNWRGDWASLTPSSASATPKPTPQAGPGNAPAGPGAGQPKPQPLPASTAPKPPAVDPRTRPQGQVAQPTPAQQNQSPSPGLGRLTAALQSPSAKDPNTPAGAIVAQYNSVLDSARTIAQQNREPTAAEAQAFVKLAESLGVSVDVLDDYISRQFGR